MADDPNPEDINPEETKPEVRRDAAITYLLTEAGLEPAPDQTITQSEEPAPVEQPEVPVPEPLPPIAGSATSRESGDLKE